MTDQENKIEEIKALLYELNEKLEANRIEHEAIKKLHDDIFKASELLDRVKKNKDEKVELELSIDQVQFQFQQINAS